MALLSPLALGMSEGRMRSGSSDFDGLFGQRHGIEQVLDFARLTAADIEAARVGSGFVSQLQQFNVGAAHVPHIEEVALDLQIAYFEQERLLAGFDQGDLARERGRHEVRRLAWANMGERSHDDACYALAEVIADAASAASLLWRLRDSSADTK